MTIKELIEQFYDPGTFYMRLYINYAEHIGDFKSDSIGLKEYMNCKIVNWCFGRSYRSLDLFIREENEE